MSKKEKVSNLITYLYETMNGELALDYANLDSENIEILLDYIEKLENIIKEVREYIEDLYDVRFTDKDKRKILEILEKENK